MHSIASGVSRKRKLDSILGSFNAPKHNNSGEFFVIPQKSFPERLEVTVIDSSQYNSNQTVVRHQGHENPPIIISKMYDSSARSKSLDYEENVRDDIEEE